jgi:hypothetical protein
LIREVIIGTSSFFLVVTGFYFLIPAWSLTSNAILGVDSTLVTNPTYLTNIAQEAAYLNTIVGLSFIATGIGIIIWLMVFSWRKTQIQDTLSSYQEVS